MKHHSRVGYIVLMVLLLCMGLGTFPFIMNAQETPTATLEGTPIEVSGVVSAIGEGTITAAGLTVDVSGITLDANIVVGTTVKVTGYLLPTTVIVAQSVVIVNLDATATPTAEVTPEATPLVTPTASPTPNPNLIVIIEGPVVSIVVNIITIYDFDIEVDPNHPILDLIEIGDFIRVKGVFGSNGVIIASVVSNISDITLVDGATVGLEGPVESINGNIIVVNGISVQFAPDDPFLQTVQIGQFVSVQGNFEGSGTTIVLIVVNIIIINNIIVDDDPYCWYHEGGMGMGHWHCDGMGMGMGMGEGGMGMGMGRG